MHAADYIGIMEDTKHTQGLFPVFEGRVHIHKY